MKCTGVLGVVVVVTDNCSVLLTGERVREDERSQTAEDAQHGQGQTKLHLCRGRKVPRGQDTAGRRAQVPFRVS